MSDITAPSTEEQVRREPAQGEPASFEGRAQARLAQLKASHAQAFAALSASAEWQRLIAIEAAIGELEALISPPAGTTAPPA